MIRIWHHMLEGGYICYNMRQAMLKGEDRMIARYE